MSKFLILTFFLLISSLCSAATKFKLWVPFTLTGNYGLVLYNIEPQLRLIYADNPFQQFLNNSGIGYQLSPHWQAWIGQTLSADSQDAVPGSADEYRIWQQIVGTRSLTHSRIVSRTRLEERKSFNFPDMAYRLRERVTWSTPLTPILAFVLYDEVFINLDTASWIITHALDQNRAYIGLEQKLSTTTYLSAGYLNQFINFVTNPQLDSVLVINIRVNLDT